MSYDAGYDSFGYDDEFSQPRESKKKMKVGLVGTVLLAALLGLGAAKAGVGEKIGQIPDAVKGFVDPAKTELVSRVEAAAPLKPGATIPVESPTARPTATAEVKSTVIPTKTPEATRAIDHIETEEGVEISYDKNRLPVSYKTYDGVVHKIDEVRMKDAIVAAERSGEPELLELIKLPLESEKEHIVDIEKHPTFTELPSTALSPEQLKERGVEIYQTKDTELYFNKAAFEEGGPLAAFNNTGRKLRVVLVDAAVTSTDGLNNGPYPEDVKKLLVEKQESIEKFRQDELQEWKQRLEKTKQELVVAQQSQNKAKIESQLEFIASIKYQILTLEKASTDELIVMRSGGGTDAVGLYMHPPVYPSLVEAYRKAGKPFIDDTPATIFISVGKELPPSIIFTAFPDGTVHTNVNMRMGLTSNRKPGLQGSFMNPYEIKPKQTDPSNMREYAVGTIVDASFVLAHEIGHDMGMAQKPIKGEGLDAHEAFADHAGLDMLKPGWDKWEKSGYKDTSGAIFTWKIKNRKTGQWQYTMN